MDDELPNNRTNTRRFRSETNDPPAVATLVVFPACSAISYTVRFDHEREKRSLISKRVQAERHERDNSFITQPDTVLPATQIVSKRYALMCGR